MKSAFTLLIVLLVSFTFPSRAAAINPPTALIVLKDGGSLHEYSPVLEYSSVEFESSAALKVVLPSGKSITITRDQIGHVFQYPNPNITLTSADMQTLSAKRSEAATLASKYAKARTPLQPIISGLDTDLQQLASGKVRYSGVWQTPGSPASTPNSGKPALTINGITYLRADITRLDNGAVVLSHEGGIARVSLTNATPELLTLLRSKSSLLASLKPLRTLAIGDQKLANASLVGQKDDTLLILHDGGVVLTTRSQVPATMIDSLFASNPGLKTIASTNTVDAPPATIPDQPAASTSALVRTPGTGTQDPEYGWKCTPSEQQAWEAACKESFADPSGQQFPSELQLRTGDHPPGANLDGRFPTYQETIAFINSKVAPNVLGFSKNSGCLLLRENLGDTQLLVAAFDPKELNSTVRAEAVGDRIRVVLEGRDGAECITWYQTTLGDNDRRTAYRQQTSEIYLAVAREEDARRVAKALCYMLVMFGGKASTF